MYRPTVLLAVLTALALAACASQPSEHLDRASTDSAATPAPTLAPTASPAPKKRRPSPAHVVAFASVTSTPIPVVKASPSPPPSPSPTPAASESASPVASPSPVAHKHVVVPMRKPDAPPQIVDVEMNTNTVGSGDTLWGKVLTSSNVASVEVRVGNIGVGLNKVGVGRFTLAYRLPSIPFFVHGTYPMRIIARNSRGDKVERSVPLTIH